MPQVDNLVFLILDLAGSLAIRALNPDLRVTTTNGAVVRMGLFIIAVINRARDFTLTVALGTLSLSHASLLNTMGRKCRGRECIISSRFPAWQGFPQSSISTRTS